MNSKGVTVRFLKVEGLQSHVAGIVPVKASKHGTPLVTATRFFRKFNLT